MEFTTENSLNRHLNVHEKAQQKGEEFQCTVCHIVVASRWTLSRHMLTHTGDKPFRCDECGKSFAQREVLKRHQQTHLDEKKHKCNDCEASFTQRVNLINHIKRMHSGLPVSAEFKCHLCPKKFLHASGLSRHLISHTGMSFKCEECGKVFSEKSSLKRHILLVHNAKQLKKEDELE